MMMDPVISMILFNEYIPCARVIVAVVVLVVQSGLWEDGWIILGEMWGWSQREREEREY